MNEFKDQGLFTLQSSTAEKPAVNFFKTSLQILGIFTLLITLIVVIIFYRITSLNKPGQHFPTNQLITVAEGMSVKQIAEALEQDKVVQSGTLLYYMIILFHDPTSIKASRYIFSEPLTTSAVAVRLTEGDFDTDLIRFTHYEGERASQIAIHAAQVLPNFDKAHFIESAEPYEGKLFPDTYLIPVTYTDEDLLELLLTTYEERVVPLTAQASNTTLTLDEVVILASIIEREANTLESMKLVSSVLQNRLRINMALQADASIEYILDKPLAELTPEDLKINSPYNTYLYPGLPPTPIGNPGLDAITAVFEPTESDYFYYITDENGKFHFAETYNEHLRNIEQYLR